VEHAGSPGYDQLDVESQQEGFDLIIYFQETSPSALLSFEFLKFIWE
jgi:hypothetical protein